MAVDGSRAQYYRQRARYARDLAERTVMPELKEEYERIAAQYEKLAQQFEGGRLKP